jgi:hypothetical protein
MTAAPPKRKNPAGQDGVSNDASHHFNDGQSVRGGFELTRFECAVMAECLPSCDWFHHRDVQAVFRRLVDHLAAVEGA